MSIVLISWYNLGTYHCIKDSINFGRVWYAEIALFSFSFQRTYFQSPISILIHSTCHDHLLTERRV